MGREPGPGSGRCDADVVAADWLAEGGVVFILFCLNISIQ